MKQELMDCFTHPVKCKLLLEIQIAGKTTAKQLTEKYSDIPPATLYRYLKRMTSDGILKIVEENQIRGTVEKTYSLAFDFGEGTQNMLEANSGDAYMQLFMQYISGFVRQFQEYCARSDINIKEDISSFTAAPIYATDEELISALEQYGKITQTLYNNAPAPERKLRTVGFILTPPEKHE